MGKGNAASVPKATLVFHAVLGGLDDHRATVWCSLTWCRLMWCSSTVVQLDRVQLDDAPSVRVSAAGEDATRAVSFPSKMHPQSLLGGETANLPREPWLTTSSSS